MPNPISRTTSLREAPRKIRISTGLVLCRPNFPIRSNLSLPEIGQQLAGRLEPEKALTTQELETLGISSREINCQTLLRNLNEHPDLAAKICLRLHPEKDEDSTVSRAAVILDRAADLGLTKFTRSEIWPKIEALEVSPKGLAVRLEASAKAEDLAVLDSLVELSPSLLHLKGLDLSKTNLALEALENFQHRVGIEHLTVGGRQLQNLLRKNFQNIKKIALVSGLIGLGLGFVLTKIVFPALWKGFLEFLK